MKTTVKYLIALTLALSTAATAVAQANHAEVIRATLGNGLRVVIVHDALAPVVATEMNYLVGSDEVPEGFPGMAHALEHMMFRGSPGLSKDQLAAIVANLGGVFNADTTQGVTQYHFVAPAQDLNVVLHTEALRMRGAEIADAEWIKERGAIEQEVSRDLSSPDFKFYTQLVAQLFDGTPYAHTPLGTRESFDKTTGTMLRAFHNSWYAPNNAILVVIGDVDPALTLAEVKAQFGDIPRKNLPTRPTFDFALARSSTVRLPTDSPYGSVYLGYRMPGMRDPDYATSLVLNAALGSQRAGLFGMGTDGTALFGGFFGTPLPHAGVGMAVGIFPRGGNSQAILAKMQSILAETAAKGVDPALVEAAKRKLVAGLDRKKNSIEGLASAWSEALAFQERESPDGLKDEIEAVTPAAVKALATRTLNPAQAITAILTPESSGKPVSGQGFGGTESLASSPERPVTLPDWAAQAFEKLDLPRSKLHPLSYTLANGLRLIVQPETTSATVQVYGRVHTNEDLQTAQGEEGVADVLDGLFTYGTASLDRLAFQQALDNISARENAGSNFSLSVPAAHFAEGMKLLADNELHPALPEPAFSVVRQQIAGFTAGQMQSPAYLVRLGLYQALLPRGDAQLRHPTPQSVASLSLNQVRRYYTQTFRPDMTTIVVVGNVDPTQAKHVVEQAFGAWRVASARPDVEYAPVPPNPPGELHVPDSSSVQDSVKLVQTISVTRDDPARYALNLGNEVLGGGFYASRLYRDLRDRSGLVYTVDTRFDLGKYRSTYAVSFGSDPDKVAAASALVVQDLKQMQQEPVSAEDLKRAKGILLRQILLSESSFDEIGQLLLTLSIEGRPLNAMTIAAEHYLRLSASDVQQAYAAYIRPEGFVIAVKGPSWKK